MRLVNIHTLKLHEFMEGQVPPYAILSHRWTEEELNFKEVLKERIDVRKRGYRKLLGACRTAAAHDVSFLWIDTCCIDKTSSAELSESINSMFAWYQSAVVCLAYLEDVESGPGLDKSFKNSVWFTRSWTLQELLAPQNVEFYDGRWTHLGNKVANTRALTDITEIQGDILTNPSLIRTCPVAQRMSWAADRRATRSEDVTYSLMGIFDINMPLLYGEGQKAFVRLQEEILRRTSDVTLLCWGLNDRTYRLLASSPTDFRNTEDLVGGQRSKRSFVQFRTSNIGLEFEAVVVRYSMETYGILLGDMFQHGNVYAVLLRKFPYEKVLHKLGVVNTRLDFCNTLVKTRSLLVLWGNEEQAHAIDLSAPQYFTPKHGFQVQTEAVYPVVPVQCSRGTLRGYRAIEAPNITGGPLRMTWKFGDTMSEVVATLRCHISKTRPRTFLFDLSFDFDSRPCCLVYESVPPDGYIVRQTSDSFPESDPCRVGWKEELSMTPIRDGSTGPTSWFLRSHSADACTYAKLPTTITSEYSEVWVYFSPPFDNESAYWRFGLCQKEPSDGELLDK